MATTSQQLDRYTAEERRQIRFAWTKPHTREELGQALKKLKVRFGTRPPTHAESILARINREERRESPG